MEYDVRGRLLTNTVSGGSTSYEYFPDGQVSRITQPDGSFLEFEYNDARHLIAIENAAGERIEYEVDAVGNRLSERIYDDQETLSLEIQRVYDELGRLEHLLRGTGGETEYEYDAAGNLTGQVDALGNATSHEFDALSRLRKTLDAVGAETEYSYDNRDNLVKVTDGEGLSTHYSYNAFGELTEIDSPDTGFASHSYDSFGNRVSTEDARGVVVTTEYDQLNRESAIRYPDSSMDVEYRYDESDTVTGCAASHPIGRMTRMIDASGATTYCYDARGNISKKKYDVDSESLSVSYDYNIADRLSGVTYPSGLELEYSRDSAGRVTSVQMEDGNGQGQEVVVSDVAYLPFGGVASYTFANQQTVERNFDLDHQISSVISPALELYFGRDAVGNIEGLQSSDSTQSPAEMYDYDSLYRLQEVQDGRGAMVESYAYDSIGNRLEKSTDAGVEVYVYGNDSHRLLEVDGESRDYDAVGNTILDEAEGRSYSYGDHNRLSEVSDGQGSASYVYNGLGQRSSKTVSRGGESEETFFMYDEEGRLLSELERESSESSLTVHREYIYLEDIPIAVVDYESGGSIYYIHADHLNTPRAVTDSDGNMRWEWAFQSNPFGEAVPDEDPENTGVEFELNLRFPGQYYDAESGLHYNYFRDYEPQAGRYVQSDPIGLAGGLNTFAYANNNALRFTDPFGKKPFDTLSDFCIGEGCICQVMPSLCPNPPPRRCLSCTQPEYSTCINQAIAGAGLTCLKVIPSRSPSAAVQCGVDLAQIALCVAQHCTRSASNCEEESCGG